MNGTAAVLFTIVTGVCCSQIAGTAKVPAGFPLDIAISPEWCGDGRYIEAKATGNHTASINGGRKVSIPDSVSQVRHLLRTRANRIVFVSGGRGISYGDFIELVDTCMETLLPRS
jgi:hypothetical protein